MSEGDEEMSAEEAAAAAEWEAAASGETVADLDQTQIDSLLGVSSENEGDKNTVGIKAMIDSALDSYERLPMLEVVFEKFIRLLSTSLRNLTEDNVDLDVKSVTSLRFGNYINSIPMPALVTIFKAKQWDSYGLFVASNQMIFALVEVLFGGKNAGVSAKTEGRPYTSIEQGVLRQLTDTVLADLSESFESLSPVTLLYERVETDPRFASIARHGDSSILVRIGVEMEDRKGQLEILFPYDTLEPIRELLLQVFIGDQFGSDNEWEKSLASKVRAIPLTVQAIIEGRASSIEEILNLKVGNTIMMENSPEDDISVICNREKILTAKLGKSGNNVAISLNESAAEYRGKKVEK